MIPSQLCTAEIWRPQTEALSARATCLIGDQTQNNSVAGMAVRILGQAPPTFALAAHGMGGFVSFEIMRQAPERVSRLLLMSTIAEADKPAQIERRRGYEKLVKAGRFEELIPERIPLLFHPDRATDERLVGIAEQMAADVGPDAFLRQQEAIIGRPDSTPSLDSIACPTMLVVGRQDRLGTVETHEEMATHIAGSELQVIEDCGHFLTLEKSNEVSALMGRWLEL